MSEMVTQRRKKILIADDSEMNRDLLAAILEDEYDIVQANDGVKAVDYLGEARRRAFSGASGSCYASDGRL